MKNLFQILLFSLISSTSFSQQVRVKIHSLENYTGYENFANEAAKKLESVLNSEKFKKKVLDGNFSQTKGYSNQEIYDLIVKAHEVQGEGGNDNIIDLRLRTITFEQDGNKWMKNCDPNSWAGTIGIDGKGDGITAICPQRLKIWSEENNIASLAAHYAHEYMHIIGFKHSWPYKSKSLVYQIGDIVEQIIKDGI